MRMSTTAIESPVETLMRRAQEAGVQMVDICKRSGVAQSTPSRWNSGEFEPKMKTIRRMDAALTEIVSERTAHLSAEG
ncbi:putative transcriptional regulator [Sphingomonas sp. UYP23]